MASRITSLSFHVAALAILLLAITLYDHQVQCGGQTVFRDYRTRKNCSAPKGRPLHLHKRNSLRDERWETRDGNPVLVSYRRIGGVDVQDFIIANLHTIGEHFYAQFGGNRFNGRMAEMNARVSPRDARGHLIASRLGGPAAIWNMVPMSDALNNGDGSGVGWKNLELEVISYLSNPYACRQVDWHVQLVYQDPIRSTLR